MRRRGRRSAAAVTLIAGAAAALVLAGCDSRPREIPPLRQWTDDMAFRISSEPSPPRARERTIYKVVVRDKESRQPIEGAEGRVFATSHDGANTWDALVAGPELGSYYATLKFITAGEWAVAIQFRRDSTKKLERMDWIQEVRAALP